MGAAMYEYKASFEGESILPWKSAMFMPRKAARIWQRVINVSVERVQDISEADAAAEGAYKANWIASEASEGDKIQQPTFRNGFANLWNSINAKPKACFKKVDGKEIITHYESYPWENVQETRKRRGLDWFVYGNPWVEAITFERMGYPNEWD